MKEIFRKFATKISVVAGSANVFLLALLIIAIWLTTGPYFGFSDTWQLVINTSTTIVTFLMVFLIQNTQNRDGKAMQLKLDELIRSTKARDAFIDLEVLNDEELAELDKEFQAIHAKQEHSEVMRKLHKHIKQEHERRKTSISSINDFLHKKI